MFKINKILPVLLCLAALVFVSCDAGELQLSEVSPLDMSVSLSCGSVEVQELDGELYLILPSGRNGARWNFEGTVLLDGEAVSGGDPFELEESGQLTVETASGSAVIDIVLSENLPSLHISLPDGELEKVNNSSDHSYSASGEFGLSDSLGNVLYSGSLVSIRGRGNATWGSTEKRPYQIELESKASLLGLAEAKKYVLLANYFDRSLLRNTVAMSLADEVFDGYSPSSEAVDLFINGSYAGFYLLCEKVGISEERIDITDLEKLTEDSLGASPEDFPRGGDVSSSEPGSYKWCEIPEEYVPEDVSGGFLLEFDYAERYPDEPCGFVTDRGVPVVIKSPEYASRSQVEYIRSYVCAFEDAIYSEDGKNGMGVHYSEYADVDSLAMRYLFEEYMLNIDGGLSSFYIYKDSGDGKLTFSCVWDYDCTLGNYALYADLTDPQMLFLSETETRNAGQAANWFYALMEQDEFAYRVRELYPTFEAAVSECLASFDALYEKIRASAAADELLYGSCPGRDKYGADSGENFEEAFAYLEDFMARRLSFFSEVFEK